MARIIRNVACTDAKEYWYYLLVLSVYGQQLVLTDNNEALLNVADGDVSSGEIVVVNADAVVSSLLLIIINVMSSFVLVNNWNLFIEFSCSDLISRSVLLCDAMLALDNGYTVALCQYVWRAIWYSSPGILTLQCQISW